MYLVIGSQSVTNGQTEIFTIAKTGHLHSRHPVKVESLDPYDNSNTD